MRRLDVSRNPLGNEAGVAILGALVNECTEYLDLSYTELRGKDAGLAIGRMLRCHTIVLRHLNVEHNNLGRHGVNEVIPSSTLSGFARKLSQQSLRAHKRRRINLPYGASPLKTTAESL